MTRSKAGSTLRDVLLDAHVRITEAHQPHLISFLGQDSKLLGLTGSPFGLVVATKALAFVVYHVSPSGAHTTPQAAPRGWRI
jgi:hypothetical protein